MYKANVFQIMFGSPSDIIEELAILQTVLSDWNALHSKKNGTVLLPIHWSTNSYPASGKHPQKILNEQVVEKSDMLVCVFGTKIGTATDTTESGTLEELYEHINADKPVMVFFKNSTNNIETIDTKELEKIKKLKKKLQNYCLYTEYNTSNDFKEIFSKKLQLFLNDNVKGFEEDSLFKNPQQKIVTLSLLTHTEQLIIQHVLSNYTYAFISQKLNKSESAIKMMMVNIFEKLHIKSKKELIDLYEKDLLRLPQLNDNDTLLENRINLSMLNPYERKVIQEVLANKTFYAIGIEMHKSESSIKLTMQNIYSKLQIRGKKELMDLYEKNMIDFI